MKKSLVAVMTLVLSAIGGLNVADAAPFDARGAGLTLANTIPDLDLALLTDFVGIFPGSVLSYGATITSTGFTAFLSGTYGGRSLNVTYTGNLSAFPLGAVTWTGTGLYGTDTWSSNGSVTFSFPTTTTFTESYTSALMVGANTGSYNLVIGGLDEPDVTYTDAVGTAVANGVPLPRYPTIKDPNNPQPQELTSDDVCYGMLKDGKCIGTEVIESADVVTSVSPALVDVGSIQVVPDASSLILLTAGLIGLRVAAWRSPRRKSAERHREGGPLRLKFFTPER